MKGNQQQATKAEKAKPENIKHLVPWRPSGYKTLQQVKTAADKLGLLTWHVAYGRRGGREGREGNPMSLAANEGVLYVFRRTRRWGQRWVAYMYFEQHSSIYGRPRLHYHPDMELIKQRASTAMCEICGKMRRSTACSSVTCGSAPETAMAYMVCVACSREGAIERTRRAGYYVGRKVTA